MSGPLEQTAGEALALIWRLRERALIDFTPDALAAFDTAIANVRKAQRLMARPLAIAGDME